MFVIYLFITIIYIPFLQLVLETGVKYYFGANVKHLKFWNPS